MTLDQFIKKWLGKEADWDEAYEGQCVDLFRYYCDEVWVIKQPDGVWGAANFWTDFETDPILVSNFTKIPNTSEFTPLKGDVMIWDFNAGGGYGHVGICTGENESTRYFKSFDQNWSRISFCEIVNHSYKNVFGVLRPKKQEVQVPSGEDTITIKQTTFEELVTKSSKFDAFKAKGWDNPQLIEQIIKDLQDSLQKEKDTNAKTAKEWKEAYQNILRELSNDLNTPQKEVEIYGAVREALVAEEELRKLKPQVEKDRKEWVEKEMGLQAEITRLKAMQEYDSVLSNVKLGELISELIKRLTDIVKYNK